jgi:hypothetical protein
MRITKNEELLVDSEMILSFVVDYMDKELLVNYLEEETEEAMEFSADCYNWIADDTEPQLGRIEFHGCEDNLLINLVGNHWNHTIKSLDEDEGGDNQQEDLVKKEE